MNGQRSSPRIRWASPAYVPLCRVMPGYAGLCRAADFVCHCAIGRVGCLTYSAPGSLGCLCRSGTTDPGPGAEWWGALMVMAPGRPWDREGSRLPPSARARARPCHNRLRQVWQHARCCGMGPKPTSRICAPQRVPRGVTQETGGEGWLPVRADVTLTRTGAGSRPLPDLTCCSHQWSECYWPRSPRCRYPPE